MELSILKSYKEQSENKSDGVYCFFKSLGSDLPQLNGWDYFMAKAEIQSMANNYQTTQSQFLVIFTNT